MGRWVGGQLVGGKSTDQGVRYWGFIVGGEGTGFWTVNSSLPWHSLYI